MAMEKPGWSWRWTTSCPMTACVSRRAMPRRRNWARCSALCRSKKSPPGRLPDDARIAARVVAGEIRPDLGAGDLRARHLARLHRLHRRAAVPVDGLPHAVGAQADWLDTNSDWTQ